MKEYKEYKSKDGRTYYLNEDDTVQFIVGDSGRAYPYRYDEVSPRPHWRGFSFALHRHGAGLLFLPGNVSTTHKRLQRPFCRPCNLPPTLQNSAQSFTAAFPLI